MLKTGIVLLPDRGVLAVTGEDGARLLQGVITNDMELLGTQPAIHAGLLTPQGKILFDFFVVKHGDGFLLDVAREQAAGLAKRLAMYKLRAMAEIRDESAGYCVLAALDGNAQSFELSQSATAFADPRLPAMGQRILAFDAASMRLDTSADPQAYHAHRIALGVPEGGKDYAFGDTFPHEALFDQLNGVSFTKGCYVGQEVVSRMQHRGTARKRVVPVEAKGQLPPTGTEVRAGDQLIGVLGSTAGVRGLALLRLDRAAELAAKGFGLTANDVPVSIVLSAWATFTVPGGGEPASP